MSVASTPTLIPTQPPDDPKIDPKVSTIVAMAKATGIKGDGFMGGVLGGILAVVIHSYVDADDLVPRVEALERAISRADEHNAWVQEALVALSEKRPLPPPPYRRMAP